MACSHCPRSGSPCAGESIPRLCQLVDPSHPDYRPAYLSALAPRPESSPEGHPAAAPPPAVLIPLADSRRAYRLGGRNCFYADPPSCGCTGLAYCHRLGRDCNIHDCLACLGPAPARST